jgi:hypothetical protein
VTVETMETADSRFLGFIRARGWPRTALLVLLLAGAGHRAFAEPALRVIAAGQSLALTLDELALLTDTDLTIVDPHDKTEHRYSGIPVRDLLARVGAPLGEKLRGPALRLAVVMRAKDGYATLFALAEFDEQFSDRTLLLADSEDGKPLSANAGPLRIIAPGDKRAARWARMVTSIEVISLPQPTP